MIKKSFYQNHLSDEIENTKAITRQQADELFLFFKNASLFRWNDANNDCEDRANAICILLDAWQIQNAKAWVFSGYVFNKNGYLKNLWKYHVAALIPVKENDAIKNYIIDPATESELLEIEDWVENITDKPTSYYLVKKGEYYIFHSFKINKEDWFKRNKRNYNWTMQGLSGINGVSSKGKAQLAFNKRRVMKTAKQFSDLKNTKPVFLTKHL